MSALLVRVGAIDVGILEAFEEENQRFTFAESYRSAFMDSRPVLGQIFEDRFPHAIAVDGPICWFTHLLPQGVMRRWRARLSDIDEDDSFEMLRILGDNLPGAVSLTEAESVVPPLTPPIMDQRVKQRVEDNSFRFSLAGAQWKLSAMSAGRGLTTNVTAMGRSKIAKFHAPEYPDLPQCEFGTMTWANAAGILVPEFSLRNATDFDLIPEQMPIGDGSVYVVDRFDRTDDSRIHIEDFAQILDRPPGDHQYHGNYEEIGRIIQWVAPDSSQEFLKLLVFNILSGNGDAHLKNFSLIYPDSRNAELSLAYDLVATCLYYAPGKEKLALNLDGNKHFDAIHLSSFEPLFRSLSIGTEPGLSIVRDTVRVTLATWNTQPVQDCFSDLQRRKLVSHMNTIPLVSECS
ncbi:type II toxin-antitoxin system HipA family toxin [Neorhodopirellula lusitana]|uniref:type II toxin-antitoxin system HipA family toxin n=1 Tax=Neorhodopirellula lusitana TaxID=445327 RepID=UPI00384EE12E